MPIYEDKMKRQGKQVMGLRADGVSSCFQRGGGEEYIRGDDGSWKGNHRVSISFPIIRYFSIPYFIPTPSRVR